MTSSVTSLSFAGGSSSTTDEPTLQLLKALRELYALPHALPSIAPSFPLCVLCALCASVVGFCMPSAGLRALTTH
jgi:hypothetical protein